jgi:hypothetical protein
LTFARYFRTIIKSVVSDDREPEKMNTALIGMILIFLALGTIIFLVVRSRHIIEIIHQKKLNSAREILQNINGNRK